MFSVGQIWKIYFYFRIIQKIIRLFQDEERRYILTLNTKSLLTLADKEARPRQTPDMFDFSSSGTETDVNVTRTHVKVTAPRTERGDQT